MKPIQLKGFKRVTLKSGKEKQVVISLSPEQLVQYKNDQWTAEGGEYEFKIGASSTDIRLTETIEISGEDKILPDGRSIFFSKNK